MVIAKMSLKLDAAIQIVGILLETPYPSLFSSTIPGTRMAGLTVPIWKPRVSAIGNGISIIILESFATTIASDKNGINVINITS